MADEKDEDQTPGSDPSSPHEPVADAAGASPDEESGPSDPVADDGPASGSDSAALVAAGSRRPVRRSAESEGEDAPQAKGRATRRRDDSETERPRTTPVGFVSEAVGELRKVVWPTAEQHRTYFVVVLVFVVFMIAVVTSLDSVLGWALLQVFGQ